MPKKFRWQFSRQHYTSWWLAVLIFLIVTMDVKAQFLFTTNHGALAIIGCSETNSDLAIPSSTSSLPITGITGFSSNPHVINLMIAASVTNLSLYSHLTSFWKALHLYSLNLNCIFK
ncbi:MAG: hypothetical protein WDM80_08335 [Limisphaerales bacterium]